MNVNPGAITIDTIAPSAPSFALANDTGTAGDGISSDGTVTVSDLEAGATWEYLVDGGHWTAGSAQLYLSEGSYAIGDIQVRQYDAAGNVSVVNVNPGAITIDTIAPSAPSFALANDTGTAGDGISSDGTVDVSGLEADATWEYLVDGGTTWTAGSDTDFTLSEGSYAMGDIQVRQSDAAGNVSAVQQNPAVVTIETTPSYSLPLNVTSSSDPNDNDSLFDNGNTPGDDVMVSSNATLTLIYAGAGNDSVTIEGGSQTIYGGSGDDNIAAGAGSDNLYGGSGADTLSGNAHSNNFYGGSGADIIIFGENGLNNGETAHFLSTNDTGDTIRNFNPSRIDPNGAPYGSSDKLDFSSMDADDNVSSSQSFVFIEQSSSDLSANSISWFYDATESRIQLAADTDGDTTTAEFVIYIENQFVQTLTSADVIL